MTHHLDIIRCVHHPSQVSVHRHLSLQRLPTPSLISGVLLLKCLFLQNNLLFRIMQATMLPKTKSDLVHVCHNLPSTALHQEKVPEFKKTLPTGPASFQGSSLSHFQWTSSFIHILAMRQDQSYFQIKKCREALQGLLCQILS